VTNEQLQRLNDERAAQQRTARESARFQLAAAQAERNGQTDAARHYDNANRRLLGRPELPPSQQSDPAAEQVREAIVAAVAAGRVVGREEGTRIELTRHVGAQVRRIMRERGIR